MMAMMASSCIPFRYAILLDEGGVYADLDVTCLQPVDKWMQRTGDYGNVELLVGFEITTNRHDWRLWFARYLARILFFLSNLGEGEGGTRLSIISFISRQ